MTTASAVVARINASGDAEKLAAARLLIARACRDQFMPFLRLSFDTVAAGATFRPNWHIEAIAYQLERVARGEIRRLIITMPPRSLKSICASVAFPAWLLGIDPRLRIICVSYAQELANSLARDCMVVMTSNWYAGVFPKTNIRQGQAATADFATTQHGFRLATSVGGTLTGRGGDIIIIDDPLKPQDAMSEVQRAKTNAWYDTTLLSRLNEKTKGSIVFVTQRLHPEDLVGHVQGSDDWEILNLPAIAEEDEEIVIGPDKKHYRRVGDLLQPAREPQDILDSLKAQMGSFAFSAQYQQNPVPADGEMIKWSWLRTYQAPPERQSGDRIVHSWDTAMKGTETADYSVCTVWLVRGDEYYVLEVIREKLDYPALKKRVIALRERDKPVNILIEDNGSGTSLIQDLRSMRIATIPIAPEGDKVTRMYARCAAPEAGKVLLPERAAWLDDFKTELLQFPHGRHDDQVDSLSQALAWIEEGRRDYRRMIHLKI